MITYELNLICETPSCGFGLNSGPLPRPDPEPLFKDAVYRGWRSREGRWYCPACVAQVQCQPSALEDVPAEIIEAALKVTRYFQSHGIEQWQLLGVASRNLAPVAPSFVIEPEKKGS